MTDTKHRARLRVQPLGDRVTPAVVTWDGGALFSDKWTARRNWVGDAAPQPGDHLVFPAGADRRTTNVNDFPAGTNFRSITFTGDGYELDGKRILVGSISGNDFGEVTNEVGNNVITLPLELHDAGTGGFLGSPPFPLVPFSAAAGTSLTVNGAISDTGLMGTLVKRGAGTVVLGGTNTYLAGTVIEEGVLRVTNAKGLGDTVGRTRVESGATLDLKSVVILDEVVTLSDAQVPAVPGVRGTLRATGLTAAPSYAGWIR